MSRPVDWSPLAASDPVPGDPHEVHALSRELKAVAAEIHEQTQRLTTLCTDDYWQAEAARTFRDTATSTATKLQKAYQRYEAATEALDHYAPVLEAQQDASLRLLGEARRLEDERASAQARLDGDEPDSDRPGRVVDQMTVEDYLRALQTLRDQADECADQVRRAGHAAAQHLSMAVEQDGLKDGHFEGMKKWLHDRDHAVRVWLHQHADVFKAISDKLGWVATIFGVAAL